MPRRSVAATRHEHVRGEQSSSRARRLRILFGDDGEGMSPSGRIPQREGVGSGVIIDKSGIVLTNNHVVEGADEVIVHLADGREFKATDIKTDPQTDLAVLRIKADEDLPAAKLGNSDDLEIGDWVIAIGNPFELEHDGQRRHHQRQGPRARARSAAPNSCRPTPRSIRATRAVRW